MFDRIIQKTNTHITAPAQETTYRACVMIVINHQITVAALGCSADGAHTTLAL